MICIANDLSHPIFPSSLTGWETFKDSHEHWPISVRCIGLFWYRVLRTLLSTLLHLAVKVLTSRKLWPLFPCCPKFATTPLSPLLCLSVILLPWSIPDQAWLSCRACIASTTHHSIAAGGGQRYFTHPMVQHPSSMAHLFAAHLRSTTTIQKGKAIWHPLKSTSAHTHTLSLSFSLAYPWIVVVPGFWVFFNQLSLSLSIPAKQGKGVKKKVWQKRKKTKEKSPI